MGMRPDEVKRAFPSLFLAGLGFPIILWAGAALAGEIIGPAGPERIPPVLSPVGTGSQPAQAQGVLPTSLDLEFLRYGYQSYKDFGPRPLPTYIAWGIRQSSPETRLSAHVLGEVFQRPESLPNILSAIEGMYPDKMLLAASFLRNIAVHRPQSRFRNNFARELEDWLADATAAARAKEASEFQAFLNRIFDGSAAGPGGDESAGPSPATLAAKGRRLGGPGASDEARKKGQVEAAARDLREKMLFGFEPTFTNSQMERLYRDSSSRLKGAGGTLLDFVGYRNELRKRLLKGLRDELGITRSDGDWAFYDEVGKWNIDIDIGVIEIQPPPLRYGQILPEMEALFRAAYTAGLKAEIAFGGIHGGGGHIHLDHGIFAQNPLLLRNLLVDVFNRPYIQAVLEELADDTQQSIHQRREYGLFRAVILEFDRTWRKRGGRIGPLEALQILKPYGMNRYRDVNLSNLVNTTWPYTVELRMHRAQTFAGLFKDLADLWIYRLANLSLATEPIPMLDLSREAFRRMQLPSVASHLWRKLIRDSRLPEPGLFDHFVYSKFARPLRLGPEGRPRLKLRYIRPHGNNGAIYEALVADPAVREIRMGPSRRRVRLAPAPELPGSPRIGVFVYHGAQDLVPVGGVPGLKEIDLSLTRKWVDSYDFPPGPIRPDGKTSAALPKP